jgi:hypothetical protein
MAECERPRHVEWRRARVQAGSFLTTATSTVCFCQVERRPMRNALHKLTESRLSNTRPREKMGRVARGRDGPGRVAGRHDLTRSCCHNSRNERALSALTLSSFPPSPTSLLHYLS